MIDTTGKTQEVKNAMRSTNNIVQHALEGAKIGGNVRRTTGTGKPKRRAANARPAVVLNVRPPSNPARNRNGRQ